jgi:hypothetical protein
MRAVISLLMAALPMGPSAAGPPHEIPSTPAGKVFAGYLEAVNAGHKGTLETFVKTHRPDRPDALERMLDLRWNTGGFDLYSIESSEPLNIQAVLHEREGNGSYSRMSVTVSDGDPAVIRRAGPRCGDDGVSRVHAVSRSRRTRARPRTLLS